MKRKTISLLQSDDGLIIDISHRYLTQQIILTRNESTFPMKPIGTNTGKKLTSKISPVLTKD